MFWVISIYFNIRNILPKSGTFLLGHPVYTFIYYFISVVKLLHVSVTFCDHLQEGWCLRNIFFVKYVPDNGHKRRRKQVGGLQRLELYKFKYWGTRCRSWLRYCTTSRRVADSIPDGIIRIFSWRNHSGCTMALGSTQSLTDMSTRNISWAVKAAGEYGWQPYHFHVPSILKSWSLNLLEPSGPVQACNGIALTFIFINPHISLRTCWFYVQVPAGLNPFR